jgi:hypothetical protein
MAETAVGYPQEEVSPHRPARIDQPKAANILLQVDAAAGLSIRQGDVVHRSHSGERSASKWL